MHRTGNESGYKNAIRERIHQQKDTRTYMKKDTRTKGYKNTRTQRIQERREYKHARTTSTQELTMQELQRKNYNARIQHKNTTQEYNTRIQHNNTTQ